MRFGTRAIDPLKGVIGDPDVRIRQAALAALDTIGEEVVEDATLPALDP